MTELDLNLFPKYIATLLSLRGNSPPPLQPQKSAIHAGKQMLESLDDNNTLCGSTVLVNEQMGCAVRAILYLWNGWPGECTMSASLADKPESLYLNGLCHRQQGEYSAAKTTFQKLDGHPVYYLLAKKAVTILRESKKPIVARFTKLLEMADEWEPYAFSDIIESHLANPSSQDLDLMLRHVQAAEMELLLCHCLEQATGCSLAEAGEKLKREQEKDRLRRKITRKPPQRRSPSQSSTPQSSSATATATRTKIKEAEPRIKLCCPKCKAELIVPESKRGSTTHCTKCKAEFSVPQRKAIGQTRTPERPPEIGIRCPKCMNTIILPASARGTQKQCPKCRVSFKVPG